MRKLISVAFFSAIVLIVSAQETVNSLDLAYPAFANEEKLLLQNTIGLYFEKTMYTDTSVGGFFYKGNGGVSGSTNLESKYVFYEGTEIIPFDEYFSKIGLSEYNYRYNKSLEKYQSNKWIYGSLGVLSLVFCFWGEIDALKDPEIDGPYTFGSEGAGWTICAVGGIGGTLFLTKALSPWNPPVPPSDKKIAQLSNEKNVEIIKRKSQ